MKVAAVVAIGFLIAGAGLTTASASTTKLTVAEPCVPVDAVAFQPAVYDTVHHDAVTETVYDRYAWMRVQHADGPDETGSTPSNDAAHWQIDHKPSPGSDPTGVAFKVGHGGDASWFFWLSSTKVVTEAYDEQVLVTPEVPAVEAVTCPDPEPEVVTEWYTWDTGAWTPNATNASNSNWPQTLVGQGQIAPTNCESTYQQDKYVGTRAAIDAVIADGILTNTGQPEDHLLVKQWLYVSTGACPVVQEVTATAPTVVPTCGANNDAVTIPTTEGVDYADTGWSHGWRTITATAKEGYKLVGTASWTFRDANTACPVTAAAPTVVPVCGRNNDTVSIPNTEGVKYLDSGWVKGYRMIIASPKDGYRLVGNWLWTFHDANTSCGTEVTALAASVVDPPVCGPDNDVLNIPTTEGVTYSDTGWVEGERTITATANEGFVLVGTASWTFYDEATACPIATVAPTVVPVCFPNNDTVTIPEVAGVIYSDTGWVNGSRTITAAPVEGYTLTGDTSWTFTDVPSAGCPQVTAFSGPDPSTLAFTGVPSNTGGLVALATMFIMAGAALVIRRRRAF